MHYELNIYFVSPSKISEPHFGSCADFAPTALTIDCASFDFHIVSLLILREKLRNQECKKCKHLCISPQKEDESRSSLKTSSSLRLQMELQCDN